MKKAVLWGMVCLTIVFGLVSCGSSGNTPLGPSSSALVAITVSETDSMIFIGEAKQFTASGHYSDGTNRAITSLVTWSASDGTKAVMQSSGLATGLSTGTTLIQAELGGVSGTTTLTVASQTIITIAGGGTGDGGPATQAQLNYPYAAATDASGNTYVADTMNNRIRKVNVSTGVITTVAGDGTTGYSGDGGLAILAQLDSPAGVAVDSSGNIYIADSHNHRIRKVTVSTGRITTVAGNGLCGSSGDGNSATAAQICLPFGIVIDSSSNIFFADTANNRIRKINASTAVMTTLAGNGIAGYSGDGAEAVFAQLNSPYGLDLDADGNIYIADTNNNRIRKVSASTGVITTVAGNGGAGYSGDSGTATSAQINWPQGVAVDSAGNIYIADTGNFRIRKVSISTGIITTVAGNGSGGYSGDGGAATSASLYTPVGVGKDISGNIYIADGWSHRVRQVTVSTGIIKTIAGSSGCAGDNGPATSAEISEPLGIAVDLSGNTYIVDHDNSRVRKVNASTGIITTIAGNGVAGYSGDGGPASSSKISARAYGVAVDASGNIFIADAYNYAVRKIAADTGTITTVAGNGTWGYSGDGGPASSAQLSFPVAVAVDSEGDLYICDRSRIRVVSASTGIITTIAGNGVAGYSGDGTSAISATINSPWGVAVDSDRNIYIADTENNAIRKVTASTGIISTIAGNGMPGFAGDGMSAITSSLNRPYGVAVDSNGNLYIADEWNGRIRKINKASGIITTIAGTSMFGFSGDGGPAPSAQLDTPTGIAVDSAGRVYIGDSLNNRIRKVY